MTNWKTRAVKTIDFVFRSAISLTLILSVIFFYDQANAQEWRGESSRFFWFNDGSCPTGGREVWREAMEMWTFYAEPRLYEISNLTDKKDSENPEDRVWCETVNEMAENHGEDVAGVAMSNGWADEKRVYRTNIAIRETNFEPCTLLHEFGHAIGLSIDEHDPDPLAVMHAYILEPGYHDERRREDCYQNFLMASDLIAAGKSYGKPANCTPYVQEDFSIYFPNIGGYEAELVYQWDNTWELLWFARVPRKGWECALWFRYRPFTKDFYITTDLYDDGDVYKRSFILKGKTLYRF